VTASLTGSATESATESADDHGRMTLAASGGTGSIIESMAARVSSPVLIGRVDELERLRAALRRALDGDSSATLLAGEAGVGKTRLVAEFAELARAEGALVLQGGCIPLGESAVPYAPVIEALRGLVRRTAGADLEAIVGPGRAELARLVPDLGPVAEEPGSGLVIESAQGRLFELLLGVLTRLAGRTPVVFVVEDLHWSDRSTRDLLTFLVRNVRDAAVMLLFTYRSDELHRRHPLLPFLAELGRAPGVERLEVAPFDDGESAAQLRAIAGHDLDLELIASINARSGGNAFFAEELLVAAGEDGRTELPPTLRDVLLARVAELAEPTQEFLRVASAAGQRVDPALLAAAATMDATSLYAALRESVGHQILVPDPTAGVERYAFRHALLQEAVYDDLLPGERNRLHAAFARTLEESSGGDATHAAELAYHWFAAHDLPRALESAVAAAVAAEEAFAFPEALTQYERSIELWDQVPDAATHAGRDRVALLAALAGVARFQEPARAVTYAQTAIRLVDEAADPVRYGLLNERLGRYAWIAGQGDLAQEAHRTAMRLIPAEPPSEARARAVAGLAQIVTLGARFDDARTLAEEALRLARAVGARDIEGHALNTRAITLAVGGQIEAALTDIRAGVAIAEESGLVDDIGRGYANWIWILDIGGRPEEAIAVAEVGMAIVERLGLMRFFGTHMLCGVADDLYRLGRWDEADAAVRHAAGNAPLGINKILSEELLGRLAVGRARFDEAAGHLQPLARLAERTADVQFIGPVQASLTELALWQGRPDGAVAISAAAIRHLAYTPEVRVSELYALNLRALADVAELARARRVPDRTREAEAAGDAVLEAFRARHAEVLAVRPALGDQSAAWLRLCEAEAARLHARPDVAAWVATAAAWEAQRRPYAVAYARWREAEARLAARDDRGVAESSLRAAHEIAVRLGAAALEREVAALAVRARLDLAAPTAAASPAGAAATADDAAHDAARFGLTPREREVLGLVALGRTNRQIADELFISENTAGVHVSNILGKLAVAGRGEAAAVAYRLGLVEPAAAPA
jgi:DNA-binding CsgD family transcriptional regulator/tetratricopeptide (TPR) repeat protein